ncbi:MAG: TIGR04086 family membrane protein [Bacillota bacterium]|nr:MAG: TIGR04086 family membrane protein [Bacillota bacterium]
MQGAEARRPPYAAPDFHVKAVLGGAAMSLLLVWLVSGGLALAVYFTAINEYHLETALYYTGMLAVAAGGAVSARAAERRGWLHGGLAGLLYVLTGSVLGHLLFPGQPTPLAHLGPRMLLGFLLGALGGAAGMLF